MAITHTIPLDTAEALVDLSYSMKPFGGYTPVHTELVETRRWVSVHELIVRRDSDTTLWVLRYQLGLTEYQDVDLFPAGGPVTVHQVEERQVVTTRYVLAGEET
ncbi:hypothetical protein HNR23_002286 [Nocardiopsis mwathae]|uniref:Uncharacterized protein n=1 Tax=Nocardiopsis mwathae TaxID=1472723 RepID=A0A7W9YJA1_9ACTN|nr:hypothetical protein [Nocardiopsis mwathae]MBB6172226.1 hypothetical protein [Nocardiopsis mwathae]